MSKSKNDRKLSNPVVTHMIRKGVISNHRSLFVIVGDYGRDQVENLHQILSLTRIKARPNVLWCYKKELGFSTHKQKRMKEIKKSKKQGLHDPDRDNPFELFITSTNIRWTYYKETEKVLGQTFGMCILQDFESLTPNILARTIETVEGGGVVVILLNTIKALKQLTTMQMDIHARFRSENDKQVVPRFNERFLLSLTKCDNCLVLDDTLTIMPIRARDEEYVGLLKAYEHQQDIDVSLIKQIDLKYCNSKASKEAILNMSGDVYQSDPELVELQDSLLNTKILGDLVGQCKTLDQANIVIAFMDAITSSTSNLSSKVKPTFSLTAGRGRGKSSSLGLCLAAGVAYGVGHVVITAPSIENVGSVFQMLLVGLKALHYKEHTDYDVEYMHCGDMLGKQIRKVNIFKKYKQSVTYLSPFNADITDASNTNGHQNGFKSGSNDLLSTIVTADLLAIDEAASIPLPIVKSLLGQTTTLLSSTIHGYEGTGRSLSLKLLDQLKQQNQLEYSAMLSSSTAQYTKGENNSGSRGGGKHNKLKHEDRWAHEASTRGNLESGGNKRLMEHTLDTPIRYSRNDPIEKWLYNLLCLDNNAGVYDYNVNNEAGNDNDKTEKKKTKNNTYSLKSAMSMNTLPSPQLCELFLVNRDSLFSYHPLSEQLLQNIWNIYTTAHYKNSPNDLQMLSDNPAHRIFVLLGPQSGNNPDGDASGLPPILCVVQIAFEGKISSALVQAEIGRGNKASGDLIPWTLCQQYNDSEFPSLSGARVVRIATHPDVVHMGYGGRALELLYDYFAHNLDHDYDDSDDDEDGDDMNQEPATAPNMDSNDSNNKALLISLEERKPEYLHWLGSAFGLTSALLSFWTKKGYHCVYIRQSANDVTGEHSMIVLKEITPSHQNKMPSMIRVTPGWLSSYITDYRKRIMNMLAFNLRGLDIAVAITLLDPQRLFLTNNASSNSSTNTGTTSNLGHNSTGIYDGTTLSLPELLNGHLSRYDIQRLELYSRNQCDHYMILDLVPALARLFFSGRLNISESSANNSSGNGDNGDLGKGTEESIRLSSLQLSILLAIGLQYKSIDSLCISLQLPSNQILGT